MSKTVLQVKNISVSYKGHSKALLNDISFSVSEGEVFSIIGKNGTGKSTLLKVISGIQKGYSGEVVRLTKKISYIPQKLELDKNFPLQVSEFISIFNDLSHASDIGNILKLMGIEDLKTQNIHTLSGGEFQKVLIVNALISNPDLLILDEPTSNIDMGSEEKFYEIITETKKLFPKLSIILVSHNLHMVYKNSDTVICLHENNFCCHGTPSEISKHPDVERIFGKYLLPYEHQPHSKYHHHS